MKLELKRRWLTDLSTIGELWVDGEFECFTLEDCMREVPSKPVAEWKVPKRTAIPVGTYKVVIDFSSRFKKLMPHILDVPGFDGVRIHCGNDADNTEGCPLVGSQKLHDRIGMSKVAFGLLFPKLLAAVSKSEEVTITVSNPA